MCKKCAFVFLSGVTAWDAICHIGIALSGKEYMLFGIMFTPQLNYMVGFGALVLCALFLYLASKTPCLCMVR